MYRSTYSFYWNEINRQTNVKIGQPMAVTLANISYISANLILAALVAFIYVSIIILQELKMRMKSICQKNYHSAQLFSLELENWRKQHDLACSLVEHVNDCFGPCLLIYLIFSVSIFVRNPSATIKEYYEVNSNLEVIESNILGFAFVLAHFFVILYPSHALKHEVIFNVMIYILYVHIKSPKVHFYTIGRADFKIHSTDTLFKISPFGNSSKLFFLLLYFQRQ